MLTNAQMIAELRKSGRVEMPIHTADDTFYILVQKSDVIEQLSQLDPSEACGWQFIGDPAPQSVRRLDVA